MAEFIGNEITYLLPGEILVTASAMKISTVLGSCVSVCLFDHERNIGGMNHYLLPRMKVPASDPLKFGDTSLAELVNRMIQKGAHKDHILARIYGGSEMFVNKGHSFNIGRQNVEIAREFLLQHGIKINGHETGGKWGRKLIFDTSAGMISCRLLTENPNPPFRESSSFQSY